MLLKFFLCYSMIRTAINSQQFTTEKFGFSFMPYVCHHGSPPLSPPPGSVLHVFFHFEIQVTGEAPVMDLEDEHTAEPQKGSQRICWPVTHATPAPTPSK